MKRIILLLLVSCLLTACASSQFQKKGSAVKTNNTVQQNLVNTNFDTYVKNNGAPDSQYTLKDGSIVYTFKKRCNYSCEMGYLSESVIVDATNTIKQAFTKNLCYNNPACGTKIDGTVDVKQW